MGLTVLTALGLAVLLLVGLLVLCGDRLVVFRLAFPGGPFS